MDEVGRASFGEALSFRWCSGDGGQTTDNQPFTNKPLWSCRKMSWVHKDEKLNVSIFRNNPLQNYIMSKGKAARFGNKLGRAWTVNLERCQQLCCVATHLKTEQDGNVGTWRVTL